DMPSDSRDLAGRLGGSNGGEQVRRRQVLIVVSVLALASAACGARLNKSQLAAVRSTSGGSGGLTAGTPSASGDTGSGGSGAAAASGGGATATGTGATPAGGRGGAGGGVAKGG